MSAEMEDFLKDTVNPKDLEKFEKNYRRELEANNVSHSTQFEYAFCLVRSQYARDIQAGILLLEDLMTRHADGKRDYIYYLAIGNTRIKNYTDAAKYCKAFLQIEPNNTQVLGLETYIKKKVDQESMKGMAVAGGAALVIGGIVGLGIALAKK
ncbi:FIS1 family protein [Megaselia abdita]